MLRVLETIQKSTHAKELEGQSKNLTQWVDEIVTAAWTFQVTFFGLITLHR